MEVTEANKAYYPNGVKVSYKYYASNEVVKIVKKPYAQCTSSLGALTSLEPILIKCDWQPEVDLNLGREFDGTFVLHSLPGRS